MKFNAHLSRAERELINQICYIQINSLKSILRNANPDIDVTTYCLENGYNEDCVMDNINRELGWFIEISLIPTKFLKSSEDELSTIKHIIVEFLDEPQYLDAKQSIMKKIRIHEEIQTMQYTSFEN